MSGKTFRKLSKKNRENIILKPNQEQWVKKIEEIMDNFFGYLDTSPTGSGKTYTSLYIAKKYNYPIFVICPPIMKLIWKDLAEKFGVDVIDIISYQTFRGKKNSKLSHDYLTREDTYTKNKHFVHFEPTEKLLEISKSGFILICDEIQNIKNNSSQYKAIFAVTSAIRNFLYSRFCLLSATPFDKEDLSINLLRMFGFFDSMKNKIKNEKINKKKEISKAERNVKIKSREDEEDEECEDDEFFEDEELSINFTNFVKESFMIDPLKTRRILTKNLNKLPEKKLVYLIYKEVIKEKISGSVENIDYKVPFEGINGFFNIENKNKLIEYIQNLSNVLNYGIQAQVPSEDSNKNPDEQIEKYDINIEGENFGSIIKFLMEIEFQKIKDIARVGIDILEENKNNKVIISVSYLKSIENLSELMQKYKPLILKGSVKLTDRNEIIKDFNENPKNRLLIMNTQVGGVGISLHDKDGRYPRTIIISPSYRMLDITQAAGRIYREGVKSKAKVIIFYGKGENKELPLEYHLFKKIYEKSKVVKSTLIEDNIRNVFFPGDYPNFYEK